jgi:hypothetical protein
MKSYRKISSIISACVVLVALVAGATVSKSQIATSTIAAHANPAIFYIKIGGLRGPAKGYFKKSIEYPGFNTMVNFPDRLKAGTYQVQFVDASGRAYPGMAHTSVTIASKPHDAMMGATSGKRTHEPMAIKKDLNAAAPLVFTIAPEDVDGDGMLDVTMTIKQGAAADANTVPTPKN